MKRICFLVDSIFSYGGVQRVTSVIVKELAKDYDVTILTFDRPELKNTSMYNLKEATITYKFISYPNIGIAKKYLCKIYSAIYRKIKPNSKWSSKLYSYSSFPAELRKYLTEELEKGHYDYIIGVHAPLAVRLATIKDSLHNAKLYGWIHNSFEALYNKNSQYVGYDRKRHFIYQFRELDKVIVLCHHDAQM